MKKTDYTNLVLKFKEVSNRCYADHIKGETYVYELGTEMKLVNHYLLLIYELTAHKFPGSIYSQQVQRFSDISNQIDYIYKYWFGSSAKANCVMGNTEWLSHILCKFIKEYNSNNCRSLWRVLETLKLVTNRNYDNRTYIEFRNTSRGGCYVIFPHENEYKRVEKKQLKDSLLKLCDIENYVEQTKENNMNNEFNTLNRLNGETYWLSDKGPINIKDMTDKHIMNSIIWLYNKREEFITSLQIELIAAVDPIKISYTRGLLNESSEDDDAIFLDKGTLFDYDIVIELSKVDPVNWITVQPIWLAMSRELAVRNKFEIFEHVLKQVICGYNREEEEQNEK